MSNLTFGIIKPDAVRAGNHGKIVDRILAAGFKIRGMKLIHQTRKQAEGFTPSTPARPFRRALRLYERAVRCAGTRKENAVPAWRADGCDQSGRGHRGTLRKEFASSIGENAVHGSDSMRMRRSRSLISSASSNSSKLQGNTSGRRFEARPLRFFEFSAILTAIFV